MESFDMPGGLSELRANVFGECYKLKKVMWKDAGTIEELPSHLFRNCSALVSISLPEGIKSMRAYTFKGCTSLESLTLPRSIERMPPGSFEGCDSLKRIIALQPTPYYLEAEVFPTVLYKTCKLYIPHGSLPMYTGHTAGLWAAFHQIEEQWPDAVEEVEQKEGLKVSVSDNMIRIEHAEEGEEIYIYTENGTLVSILHCTEGLMEVSLPKGHVYFIKNKEKSCKIRL